MLPTGRWSVNTELQGLVWPPGARGFSAGAGEGRRGNSARQERKDSEKRPAEDVPLWEMWDYSYCFRKGMTWGRGRGGVGGGQAAA